MTKRAQQAADYRYEVVREAVEQDEARAARLQQCEQAAIQDAFARQDQQWSEMRADPDLPTLGDGTLPPGDG